jgi:hypothetical protein
MKKQQQIVRPSLRPQKIDDNAWYYESRGHIEIVVYVTTQDGSRVSRIINIPWRKIERSALRCRPNEQ